MKRTRRSLVLVAGLALVACDAVTPAGPDLTLSPGSPAAARAGWALATGRAAVIIPDPLINTKPEEYSFTAHGSVLGIDATGQMQFTTTRTPEEGGIIRVHAEIICMGREAGVGNHARIGAVVQRSTDTRHFPLRSGFIFGVTDNGEGRHDPPDLASSPLNVIAPDGKGGQDTVVVRAEVRAYCEAGVTPTQEPVLRGNVQVR